MEILEQGSIDYISAFVSKASFREKRKISVNTLIFNTAKKKSLKKQIAFVDQLFEKVEAMTYTQSDLNDAFLEKVNSIISMGRDLANSLNLYFLKCKAQSDHFYDSELIELKSEIEDFGELIDEIESIYFHFPNDKKFQEADNKLKSLLS